MLLVSRKGRDDSMEFIVMITPVAPLLTWTNFNPSMDI